MLAFLPRTVLILAMAMCLLVPASSQAQADLWPDLSKPPPSIGGGEADAALLVSIEKYAFVDDVAGARANGQAWHEWLTQTRGVPVVAVRHLRDKHGTAEQILQEAIRAAERVGPGGTLWFVFIGHGAPSTDGTGLLVGADAQQSVDNLLQRSVRQNDLFDELEKGPQERTIVVLDACFSGKSSTGRTLVPDLQPLVPNYTARSSSSTVLSAGHADQFAGPLPGLERPAFSYLVLGALRGWGDTNSDGEVTAREAVDYSRHTLGALVYGRTQTPEITGPDANKPLVQLEEGEAAPDIQAISSVLEAARRHEQKDQLYWGEDIENDYTDETSYIYVEAFPSSARIFINGEEAGQGRVQVEKPLGRYVVVGDLGKYHPASQAIELGSDAAERVILNLEQAFGTLAVTSEPPGAEVWIRDLLVGTTPWTDSERASGTYEVRVALDGHLSESRTITVRDGQSTPLEAVLQPNWGGLSVASNPVGASIVLNGETTGMVTPHTFQKVPAGMAEVRLSLVGYGERVERPTVERKAVARMDVTLKPMLGMLAILASFPDGTPCAAEVAVDGEALEGVTPMKIELPARRYEVQVRCDEHVGSDRVQVVHNDKVSLTIPVVTTDGWYNGEKIFNELTDETGFLVVHAEPQEARIYVDGELIDAGKVQVEKMVGRYVVTAELGDRYHPVSQEVKLGTENVHLDLALTPAFGTLGVTSDPTGAQVFLDGDLVGVTPWESQPRSRDYAVRVALGDYMENTSRVTVADDESTHHHVRLAPDWGELRLESEPPGASITLNGAATGRVTPYRFDHVISGYAEVRLALEGYGETVVRPQIERQAITDVSEVLQPKLGQLVVRTKLPDGSVCEGDVAINGVLQLSRTPFKTMLPAKMYDVQARCGDHAGGRQAGVIHNDRVAVDLTLEPGGEFRARPPAVVLHRRQRAAGGGMLVAGGLAAGAGFALMGVMNAKTQSEMDESAYRTQRNAGIAGLAMGAALLVRRPSDMNLTPHS